MASLQRRIDDLAVKVIPEKPLLNIFWSEELGYYRKTDETKIDYRAFLGDPDLVTRLSQAEVDELEKRYTLFVLRFVEMDLTTGRANYDTT